MSIKLSYTTDVMEVTVEHLSDELIDHLVQRIIAEVPGINRVLFDYTPKPQMVSANTIKDGGLSPDGDSVYIRDHDELPRAGNVYVFCATQEPDGTPLVCGPYSNMPIKQEDENDTTLVRYREVARSLQEF